MRIDVKDTHGRPRLTVHVDPASPPTVIKASDGRGPALSLDWDKALDDKRQLRHCPVCGNAELYNRKLVPQLTVFALIVLAAVLAMIFLGFDLSRAAVVVLVVVLLIDGLIWFFAERMVVCYRCGSEFRDTPVPPSVRGWDASVADRYPPQHEAATASDVSPVASEAAARPGQAPATLTPSVSSSPESPRP